MRRDLRMGPTLWHIGAVDYAEKKGDYEYSKPEAHSSIIWGMWVDERNEDDSVCHDGHGVRSPGHGAADVFLPRQWSDPGAAESRSGRLPRVGSAANRHRSVSGERIGPAAFGRPASRRGWRRGIGCGGRSHRRKRRQGCGDRCRTSARATAGQSIAAVKCLAPSSPASLWDRRFVHHDDIAVVEPKEPGTEKSFGLRRPRSGNPRW